MGSGKTYVADCFLDFINEDVLIFKNSYQEAINLDDILLSMFKDFSIYHNEKKIILPKIDTNIFSEKINAYIKYCNSPMLFIFDSFEINMRSRDSQKDILDFINYLSHFEKIKIVICSRSFKKDDLKIMGRWIKGRLVASGLVDPVNNIESDSDENGIITKEMLIKYGRDTISLTKTDLKTTIKGKELDIWMLSFLPESKKR